MNKKGKQLSTPARDDTTGPKKDELLRDTVYRQLRIMIASGRFKPGQRFNVEELARELGVSRTPVWEAVRGFRQEGILKNIPNRGVFLVESPLERVRDVIQVRGYLERLACKLAIGSIDRGALKRLSLFLKEQLTAIENADVPAYISVDTNFHRLICQASGNLYLKGLYESLTTFYVVPALLNFLPFLHDLYPIHQQIIEALSAGDIEEVDRAAVFHNDIILKSLEQQIHAEARRKEIVRRIKGGEKVT
jgi:DNA-binding GntR family transcriptional regulator